MSLRTRSGLHTEGIGFERGMLRLGMIFVSVGRMDLSPNFDLDMGYKTEQGVAEILQSWP